MLPVQSPQAAASSGQPAGGLPIFGPDAMPAFMAEMLRQQREMMAMNQQLIATMLRRMDLEEERRNKAEEKVHEAAEAAKQAAAAARTRDPFDPSAASRTATPASAPSSGFGGSNRAEKYLPSLPVMDHQGMGKGRMKEVETWHSFMETLSSWLALQEEAFVRELQLCVPVKAEIKQIDLNAETAARSSKLFYYLTQSLAKWERGIELLRSCSKRQGQSACGYEVIHPPEILKLALKLPSPMTLKRHAKPQASSAPQLRALYAHPGFCWNTSTLKRQAPYFLDR